MVFFINISIRGVVLQRWGSQGGDSLSYMVGSATHVKLYSVSKGGYCAR